MPEWRKGMTALELRDALTGYIDTDPAGGREELLVKINGDLRQLGIDYVGPAKAKRLILRAGRPVK
jgi:hypothetical protein